MTDKERETELQEIRHKINQERSRLTNLAMQLDDLGESKERTELFESIRALDKWKSF